MTIQAPNPQTTSIDPATQIGPVALTVADLGRSVDFYTEAIGFSLLERQGSTATLGVEGAPLLLLTEQLGAEPAPTRSTGLYHFAILLPTRADLGSWLRHWLESGYPMVGQGDHIVSEALYLSDPDGNGIEVYQDRPRETWSRRNGQIVMGTGPVDVRELITEADRRGQPWTGLPAGTRIGHIHLQVADIPQAEAFYHGTLGFDVMARMPSALFISAGGYHHHIGLNIWNSRGAPRAPEGSAGLRFFVIEIPAEGRAALLARLDAAGIDYTETDDVVVVRDPWENTILLHNDSVANTGEAEKLRAAV